MPLVFGEPMKGESGPVVANRSELDTPTTVQNLSYTRFCRCNGLAFGQTVVMETVCQQDGDDGRLS